MNNFIYKLNHLFVSRDLSDYPELYNKKDNSDLSYRLLSASNAVFYDNSVHTDTIDWKEI